MGGTDHERVHGSVRWRTGPLTAQIEKDRAVLWIEKLVINPVSLAVVLFVPRRVNVEMINLVYELQLVKVVHGDGLKLFMGCGKTQDTSECKILHLY